MKASLKKSITAVDLKTFLEAPEKYGGAVSVNSESMALLSAVGRKFENTVVFEDCSHVLCDADCESTLNNLAMLKKIFSKVALRTVLQYPNFDTTWEKFFEYAPDLERTADVLRRLNALDVDELLLDECGSQRVIWKQLKRELVLRFAETPEAQTADVIVSILSEHCGKGADSAYEFIKLCKRPTARKLKRVACDAETVVDMVGELMLSDREEQHMRELIRSAEEKAETDEQKAFVRGLALNFDEEWIRYRANGFELELMSDGRYEFTLEFKGNSYNSVNYIYFDGMTMGYFRSPGKDKQARLFTLRLKKGIHRLEVIQKWSNISYDMSCIIRRVSNDVREPQADFDSLVTPDPLPCVKELMSYFKSVWGKKIVLGQHAKDRELVSYRQIQALTGKSPAILGMELLSYSGNLKEGLGERDSAEEIAVNSGTVDTVIEHLKKNGGILTCTWHWFSPIGGRGKSFYTDLSDFDTKKAVTVGTEEYKAVIRDIDIISEQFKRFEKENIPILWRPLHEAEGGWFWWGKDGADACKKLYRIMFERMVGHHKLRNLIWVWNSLSPEWYPGNDTVDIISVDRYVEQRRPGTFAIEYDRECLLNEAVGASKPIALGEFGCAPVAEALGMGMKWLYGMAWNGIDYMDNEYVYLRRLYNSPSTVTLEELPYGIRYSSKAIKK